MTDKELNIALREMARAAGLCDEWYSEWSDESTIDECLERYVRGFDFACDKDYPPLGFIREHFRPDDLRRHNIFLDEEVVLDDAPNGTYVLLGDCTGELRFSDFAAARVYLRHSSRVRIVAEGFSKVFVSCGEKSQVEELEANKTSHIHITRFAR